MPSSKLLYVQIKEAWWHDIQKKQTFFSWVFLSFLFSIEANYELKMKQAFENR